MKILFTADTHVHPGHLERLLKAAGALRPHVVIMGGDLIPDWKGSIADSIEPHRRWVSDVLLPRLRQFRETFPEIRILLDLGNDDIAAARPLLEAEDGNLFHLLHQRLVEIGEDLVIAGYMTVNPTPFAIKDREKPDCRDNSGLSAPRVVASGYVTGSGQALPWVLDPANGTMEDDLKALVALLNNPAGEALRVILVCHAPPRDTALDHAANGAHVGSLAVRRFLAHFGPSGRLLASLHGHIHESPAMSRSVWEKVEKIPAFNAGQQANLFRALLLDTTAIPQSAQLVMVTRAGEMTLAEAPGG